MAGSNELDVCTHFLEFKNQVIVITRQEKQKIISDLGDSKALISTAKSQMLARTTVWLCTVLKNPVSLTQLLVEPNNVPLQEMPLMLSRRNIK